MPIPPVQTPQNRAKTRSILQNTRIRQLPSPGLAIASIPSSTPKTTISRRRSSFAVYIDPKISSEPSKSPLFSEVEEPSKSPSFYIEIPPIAPDWLEQRQALSEIDPNVARPGDIPWTLARLPNTKINLASLKK